MANTGILPVLIVGAGPVGLTLAIDLAHRGIPSRVVEKRESHGMLPKMERVNPRTMEHFRRLGLAKRIREAGLPSELPMDVLVTDAIFGEPLIRIPQPSVDELQQRGSEVFDGTMPLEPYHVVSQYTLEPLLRRAAEALGVRVDFGQELVDFTQDEERVAATVRGPDGERRVIEASYLVGCDGGSSTVRKRLGFTLEGEPELAKVYQGLIFSEELYDRLPFRGRHFHFLDEHTSFLIVQDDTKHFTLHTRLDGPEEMTARFRELVGDDVEFEVLFSGEWTMRAMLADHYGTGRVFIAGDAAHLTPPTAGLGMNTGVGDALDLAWKLQGALEGWGGPRLLPSYEIERRAVGRANVAYSLARLRARQLWRGAVSEEALSTPEGRERIIGLVEANEAKAGSMEGMELGYRYAGSPLIPGVAGEAGDSGEEGIDRPYSPTTELGSRLPHAWIDPGRTAVQDLLPLSTFTLLAMRRDRAVASDFAAAFASLGAPLSVITLAEHRSRDVYGHDFVLLRPDMHVVWTGDDRPLDAARIASTAIGAASEAN